jgi:hypothetical protein
MLWALAGKLNAATEMAAPLVIKMPLRVVWMPCAIRGIVIIKSILRSVAAQLKTRCQLNDKTTLAT